MDGREERLPEQREDGEVGEELEEEMGSRTWSWRKAAWGEDTWEQDGEGMDGCSGLDKNEEKSRKAVHRHSHLLTLSLSRI